MYELYTKLHACNKIRSIYNAICVSNQGPLNYYQNVNTMSDIWKFIWGKIEIAHLVGMFNFPEVYISFFENSHWSLEKHFRKVWMCPCTNNVLTIR